MVDAGITDPRNGLRPSWQEMTRRTGIHTTTLSRVAKGERRTRQEVVDRVAEELRLPPQTVNGWLGRTRTVGRPYVPPAEASLLSQEERDAVDRIIVLLALSKREPRLQ